LTILDNLKDLNVEKVFSDGRLVAENGQMLPSLPPQVAASLPSVKVDWEHLSFEIPADGERARVIGVIEGQVVTEALELPVKRENGLAVADVKRDILKLAVIERHRATSNVGLGLVKGMGLQRGALASTVAHDSHNLIVVGANDSDMFAAAQAVAEMGGGLVAVADGKVISKLPLPVAGLISDEPLETVRAKMDGLQAAARDLGSLLHAPFMTLNFLALPVIPTLRLTDKGLVDVNRFDFVPLFVR
jgi:adenine deaminase